MTKYRRYYCVDDDGAGTLYCVPEGCEPPRYEKWKSDDESAELGMWIADDDRVVMFHEPEEIARAIGCVPPIGCGARVEIVSFWSP